MALGHFAHQGIGRVEHIADLILHGLTHQQPNAEGIQPICLLSTNGAFPWWRAAGLVQWAGVAQGEKFRFCFAARPVDGFLRQQLHLELNLHGALDAGAGDLAPSPCTA